MLLHEYLSSCSTEERRRLWKTEGQRQYIYNLSMSLRLPARKRKAHHRLPSPKFAMWLEKVTGGKVSKAELRPDLWG